MKYLFLHCEGMTKRPIPGVPTPAELADTPFLDHLCKHSAIGTVMPHNPALKRFPGDTALALLSYNADRYGSLFLPPEKDAEIEAIAAMLRAKKNDAIAPDAEAGPQEELSAESPAQEAEEAERASVPAVSDTPAEGEAPDVQNTESKAENPLSDEIPASSDEPPALPDEAPALPDEAPALPNEAPTLPDEAPALPDETPALSDETPAVAKRPENEEESATEPATPVLPTGLAKPMPFEEKWGVKSVAFTQDSHVAEITRTLGIPTAPVPIGEDGMPSLAQAIHAAFDAGRDFVYCYVASTTFNLAWLDAELSAIYSTFAGSDETLSFLLVTPEWQEGDEAVRPCPYLLFPADEGELTAPRFTERYAENHGTYIPKGRALLQKLLDREPADAPQPPTSRPHSLFGHLREKVEKVEEEKEESTPISHSIFEFLRLFTLALSLVLVIMMVFVRHSPVQGPSMQPTLQENDVLLIAGNSYHPEIGDIVIAQTAAHNIYRPLVKRVIATGGDSLRINFETWEIWVNGKLIDQSYLEVKSGLMHKEQVGAENDPCHFEKVDPDAEIYETTVPEGCVFLMGDNRQDSTDSRLIGFVEERCIVGKVVWRLFPFDKFGSLDK